MEVTRAFNHHQDLRNTLQIFNVINSILNSGGQQTSDERGFHRTVSKLVDEGILVRDSRTVRLGPEFEVFILSLCQVNEKFAPLLIKYRKLVLDSKMYDDTTSNYTAALDNIKLYDHKIAFLAGIVSGLDQKIEQLNQKIASIEALFEEFDFTLSVMESMVYNESTDS